MLDLYIKTTLEDSIYSFYKKRLADVMCVECRENGVKGKVEGSVSPWAYSFGTYLIFRLQRFDKEGKMNPRGCVYPSEIDMVDYIDEENIPKGSDDCLFRLIGVTYHDVVESLADGKYGAYVLREVVKQKDADSDDDDEEPKEVEKENVWHQFTGEEVTRVEEKVALSVTEGVELLFYERMFKGPQPKVDGK